MRGSVIRRAKEVGVVSLLVFLVTIVEPASGQRTNFASERLPSRIQLVSFIRRLTPGEEGVARLAPPLRAALNNLSQVRSETWTVALQRLQPLRKLYSATLENERSARGILGLSTLRTLLLQALVFESRALDNLARFLSSDVQRLDANYLQAQVSRYDDQAGGSDCRFLAHLSLIARRLQVRVPPVFGNPRCPRALGS